MSAALEAMWAFAESPAPCGDDRETAAVGLAEEAEDAALREGGWRPVGVGALYWRDPYTSKVFPRVAALDLHARDAAGAL